MTENDNETENNDYKTITVSKETFEELKYRKETLSLSWDKFLSSLRKAIDNRDISDELEFWSFVEDKL